MATTNSNIVTIFFSEFSNTEPEDLWNALNESVVDSISRLPAALPTVMENWTKNSGYPILTVTLNGNQVNISQVNTISRQKDLFCSIFQKTFSIFENTVRGEWVSSVITHRLSLYKNFQVVFHF